MAHLLDGVAVPLVTQLDERGVPDVSLATDHLALLAAAGVDTLMLLGTNGEGATLPAVESAAFARDAAAEWRRLRPAGRVSVTAFGAGTREALERAALLISCGPDLVVLPPPFYFRYGVDEIVAHYRAAAAIGVPVVAYDTPRYSGNPLVAEVMARIAELDHVVGVKDSSGNDEAVLASIALGRQRPGFAVSQGNERRLAWALCEGAAGITPGLANLAPATCVALCRAVRENVPDEARAAQRDLEALTEIHSVRPGVAAMKAALSLVGLGVNRPDAPFAAFSPTELTNLAAVLGRHARLLISPLVSDAAPDGRLPA